MKRLNNKGYVLVEIILASAIAMGITYFVTDLTIKLKNRNDDLLVKTLASTDQGIIYNTIMKDLYAGNVDSFTCSNINISGNTFKYKGFTNIVNKYTTVKYNPSTDCKNSANKIEIKIGLGVSQLSKDNFDVNIVFNK